MASLNPTLQTTPGFEQPIVDTSSRTLVNAASDIFGAITARPEEKEPSEADKKAAILKPIADRLYQIETSGMSSDQKIRASRSVLLEANRQDPQYSEDYARLGQNTVGVEGPAPKMTTPEDAQTIAFNAWIEDPTNVFRVNSARARNDDGTLNPEATRNMAMKVFYEDLAADAAREDIARELELVQGNTKLFEERARSAISQEILPYQRKSSTQAVMSLATMAAMGDVNLDSPDEQLAELRRMRGLFKSKFASEYGGLPSTLYEPYLADALEPFDTLIETATNMRGDMTQALEAFRAATQLQVGEAWLQTFGFADPNLQKAMMETFITQNLGNKATDFLAEIDRLVRSGQDITKNYSNFLPPVQLPTTGTIGPNQPIANSDVTSTLQGTKPEDLEKTISAVAAGIPDGKSEAGKDAVALLFGDLVAHTDATALPVGGGLLAEVFSPNNVNALREVINSNDVRGQDIKQSALSFIEQQMAKNKRVIDNKYPEGSRYKPLLTENGWRMFKSDKRGRLVDVTDTLLDNEATSALKSMNTLLKTGNLLSGGTYNKDFYERATEFRLPTPVEYDRRGRPIQSNDTIQGGGGSTGVDGGLGEDTLGGLAPSSLIRTESGGNWNAKNSSEGAGGTGHFGRVQFGRARFNEAKAAGAVPSDMTIEEFGTEKNKDVQVRAERWHFGDIQQRIDTNNLGEYLGQVINGVEMTRDGMVAIAHLGGFNGLKKHLTSNGKYNPSDDNGTSLSDYARIHSGNTSSAGGAPVVSARPQEREELPAGEGTQSTEMASGPASQPLSEATAPATPSVGTEQPVERRRVAQDQGQTDVLSQQSQKLLTLLNRNAEDIPKFSSEQEAAEAGLPENSLVIVNGEVMVL